MVKNTDFSFRQIGNFFFRLLFVIIIPIPFLWANKILGVSTAWSVFLLFSMLLALVPESLWRHLPRLSSILWRSISFFILVLLPSLTDWPQLQRHPVMASLFGLSIISELVLSMIYRRPNGVLNVTMVVFGLGFALFFANVGAGIFLKSLTKSTLPELPDSGEISPPEVEQVQVDNPTGTPIPTMTSISTPRADPSKTPEPTSTPEPERPIAGFGYLEWLEDNGEAEWTHLTGYGNRVNSIAHAYMVDADNNIIYDNIIEYNGKGYRGPEVSYEKPDDVYRILILGDSFVEAIQVDYPKTFYALLEEELNKHNDNSQKYEVVAMGRTGWGTVNETVYYQVEGYKYDADLVILMFFINDVADNFPIFFYPNINNTNYDFLFEGDTIRVVDTNLQSLPPNSARLLYNALPEKLRNLNLARLFVRMGDPPTPVMTPGGIMTRVHPQFYIYVTEPEMEGYDEAWTRTERALSLLARDVAENGSQLVIMPVFLGEEMIRNVSSWFPGITGSWKWDIDLPENRLQTILDGLPAVLVSTHPTFESYADSVGGEVHNLLFLPDDGHFNEMGHQLTKDAIYNWLVEQGITNE